MDDERRCKIVAGDLFKWFAGDGPVAETDRADLIFLDPPTVSCAAAGRSSATG